MWCAVSVVLPAAAWAMPCALFAIPAIATLKSRAIAGVAEHSTERPGQFKTLTMGGRRLKDILRGL